MISDTAALFCFVLVWFFFTVSIMNWCLMAALFFGYVPIFAWKHYSLRKFEFRIKLQKAVYDTWTEAAVPDHEHSERWTVLKLCKLDKSHVRLLQSVSMPLEVFCCHLMLWNSGNNASECFCWEKTNVILGFAVLCVLTRLKIKTVLLVYFEGIPSMPWRFFCSFFFIRFLNFLISS